MTSELELFAAFLKLDPLLLLKVVAKQRFGPWGAGDDSQWRYVRVWTALIVLSVVAGGLVSVFVLSEVLPVASITRGIVVVAGCLSLLLLALHIPGGPAPVHRMARELRIGRCGAGHGHFRPA